MRDYHGPVLHEAAPAKINLALHVTGKRDDGYHLLDSLVVFTTIGDVVTLSEGEGFSVSGAFARDLTGRNLCQNAQQRMGLRARISLCKNLPVASGIGGGSADAAAVFRAFARQGHTLPPISDIVKLGADIPACLRSTPALMRGIGDQLQVAPVLPDFHLVLVNPGTAISTARIFSGLSTRHNAPLPELAKDMAYRDLLDWLHRTRNDLQPVAETLAPDIGLALAELVKSGADFTRMSGSGATCFGIYPSAEAAAKASGQIGKLRPAWWVCATGLAPICLAG